MREEKITADRLAAFSDGVFAVIVTIMVLDFRAPDQSDMRCSDPPLAPRGPWQSAVTVIQGLHASYCEDPHL
jgi:uncharacterized membrane protein